MSDSEHKMTQEQIDASIDCAARVLKLDGIDIYAKPGEPGVVELSEDIAKLVMPEFTDEAAKMLDSDGDGVEETVFGVVAAKIDGSGLTDTVFNVVDDGGDLVLPEGFENLPPEMLHIEDQEFKPAE